VKEELGLDWLGIDLSPIWAAESTSVNVLADDCPIVEYLLCDDDRCDTVLDPLVEGWFRFSANSSQPFADSTLELYLVEPFSLKEHFLVARTESLVLSAQPIRL